jgi:PLP dependent protein
VPQLPRDIQWHFIGHIQTNKIKKLMSVAEALPDLAPISLLIETVDSEKLATKLNKECEKLQRQQPILIQVLSSDEDTKHGVEAAKVTELLRVLLE